MAQQPPNPNRVSGMINPGGRYGYRKEYRQEKAAQLAEARAKRSPQEQIAILDKRLGKGKGAKKERARLKAEMKKQ